MHSSARSPECASDARLEAALKDFGFAVKSLQLYPPTSPVVRQAVVRANESLGLLLETGRVIVDVTPRVLRRGDVEVGAGNALIEQLARRMHRHGIARLHFDPRMGTASLQRLAELVAADRHAYDERGGLDVVFDAEGPPGIRAEFLALDRLFDEDAEETVEDIWVALLEGFGAAADVEDVDWTLLASNVDRLQKFVAWMTDNIEDIAERTGHDKVDAYRFVSEKIGTIAAALGGEHVNFLVLAVRKIFDQIDPETLIDLLADPLEVDAAPSTEGSSDSMSLSDFIGGAGTAGELGPGRQEERRTIDITQVIASGLEPEQARDLILHTMRTRKRSSTRLYGLFERMMRGREDRLPVARRVRGLLDQEISESGEDGLLENWARIADALDGEAPERFVDASYDLALRALQADDSLKGVWDVDRIRPRLAEMKPSFLVQRKALVLADVLADEQDDDRFRTISREFGKALREAAVHEQYFLVSRLLATMEVVAGDAARGDTKREIAAGIVDDFFQADNLRDFLRRGLSSRHEVGELVTIVERRSEAVVPVLLDILADEDNRRVRQRLLQVLTAMGSTAMDAVADRLDDERWYFVRNLLLLLGEGGDDVPLEQIVPLLRHDDARVRRRAVETVIKLGGDGVAEALIESVGDSDPEARVTAIHGLGFYPSAAGIDLLRELLASPNLRGQSNDLIATAAIALGRLRDEQSRAALAALARRPWLFAAQRQPVIDAARWAVKALDSERPTRPPEPAIFRDLKPGRRRRGIRLR